MVGLHTTGSPLHSSKQPRRFKRSGPARVRSGFPRALRGADRLEEKPHFMHTRKLLIGLVVAGLLAAGFGNTILPAGADERTVYVTLVTGETVPVTVTAPAGTPADQLPVPTVSTPVVSVSDTPPPPTSTSTQDTGSTSPPASTQQSTPTVPTVAKPQGGQQEQQST